MAVDSTVADATSGVTLEQLVKGAGMQNLFGTGGDNTGGLVGGLILGSLLRNNGNLFGGNGDVYGGVRPATPVDVQNTVGFINTIQDINSARRDIFQAEGNVQAAISAASNSLNTQSLQGQIALLSAINNSTQATGNGIDSVNQNISDHTAQLARDVNSLAMSTANNFAMTNQNMSSAAAGLTNLLSTGFAAINQNVTNGTYQTAQAIRDDGDKTRALIQSLSTADLNRQITVAQNEISELRNRAAVVDNGHNITMNVNQNQMQMQQQQQAILQTSLLQGLLGEIQRNTQSVVNLGTMSGSAGTQTASNTKVY